MKLPEVVKWQNLTATEQTRLLERPAVASRESVRLVVKDIVEDVRRRGDSALKELTAQLDGARLDDLEVDDGEWNDAFRQVGAEAKKAMERAMDQIDRFHFAQLPAPVDIQVSPGVRCQRVARPISRVGLYVPSGSAPLLSTVLMLGVPARLAGCGLRILAAPPDSKGRLDPHILVAARLAGATSAFKVGGAQAIAAMAYGTESIPKVDKIFGPGNAFVTEAKQQVSQDPAGAACDMPAGPSEVLVIADGEADPSFVAADLLSQAEHGVDSQVVLVATDGELIARTRREIERQVQTLPRRSVVEASLQHARFVMVSDVYAAFEVSNRYAPEHLIIQTRHARDHLDLVESAGSVFLGPWTPESCGDYASGTNHVLPTYGYAKSYGALSVDSFLKQFTVQELDESGLADIGPVVQTLAEIEGLRGHSQAVTLRLAKMEKLEGGR